MLLKASLMLEMKRSQPFEAIRITLNRTVSPNQANSDLFASEVSFLCSSNSKPLQEMNRTNVDNICHGQCWLYHSDWQGEFHIDLSLG